jgi:CHAT domain-containing protein/Tfp pilus assembly protein PilF
MSWRLRRAIALVLLTITTSGTLTAQRGLVAKGEIFFAGRQGRWTLLIALTVLFGTQEQYGLAMDAAKKALHIAESSGDDARAATSLRYLAVLYEEQGKYQEAQAAVERALALREKSAGPDDPAVADQLVELARLQRKQQKLQTAEPLLDRAENIRQNAFGKISAVVADVQIERALLRTAQKRYSDAEPLYQHAIEIKEKVLAVGDPDVADARRLLADNYLEEGHYKDAEPLYEGALQVEQGFLGVDDPIVIPTLTNLAVIYEKAGRAQDAAKARKAVADIRTNAFAPLSTGDQQKEWIKLVSRSFSLFNASEFSGETEVAQTAVRFAEAKFGPQDFRVAAFLMLLSYEYGAGQAAFATAEKYMQHAVRLQEKTLGTEEASLAETLFFYSDLLQREHKDRAAEAALLRSLKIQEKSLNARVTEDPYMHSPRVMLSQMYLQQGHYSDAEKLFKDAIGVQQSVRGPEPPRDFAMAGLLSGLAYVYRAQGKPEQAIPLLQQAITYQKRAWGLGWGAYKHMMVARAENDLANAYLAQRSYGEAESTYEKAIKLRGWVTNTDATQMRWNLAYAYQLDHKVRRAEELLKKELAFDEQHNLSWHVDTTCKKIASLYIDEGRYAEAEPFLERSLKIEESTMQPESPFLANTLYDLAKLTFGLGRAELAQAYFARSFSILSHELQYYFSYMSESDRLRVLDNISYRGAAYFSFVERFYSTNPQLAAEMYDLVLSQKGIVARSIESLRRKLADSGDAETITLFDELSEKRAQLAGLVSGEGALSESGRKKIERLRAQADDLEANLAARSQTFAQDQKQQRTDWKAIRDALSSKGADAAVEFVLYPLFDGKKWADLFHYAALVITPKSQVPQFIFLGDAAKLEAEPVQEYKAWIARPASQGSNSPGQPGHALYDAFWKPLEGPLGPATRVYVAPDGVLNQVSLAVVPMGDGRLLSDQYDLRVLNGTADLLHSTSTARSNTAVLIGNPKFALTIDEQKQGLASLSQPQSGLEGPSVVTLKPSEIPAAVAAPLSRGLLRGGSSATCETDSNVVPPLLGTENEVRDVFSSLQQNAWVVQPPFTGSQALEEVIKRVHHPRVLHIATHGFFLPDAPSHAGQDKDTTAGDPMLRSGLLLAGAARSVCGAAPPEGIDDGVLTAYEASLLNLQGTELVVLSACETGLGAARVGEGVFGLRRAFEEAGADSVLISMWKVPDEETRRLMALFYQNWLAGNDKHRALQLAQQALRKELKATNEDYPYNWGAFVLVGP